jgi:hypothetical protein
MLDPALQVGGGTQQVSTFAQQGLSGLGKTSAVPAAVEQLDVEVLFEFLYGVGNGRGTRCNSSPAAAKLPLREMESRTSKASSEILMVATEKLGYHFRNN